MNVRNALSVTSFAWLEIKRTHLWRFVVALTVIGCAVAEFAASIAVTESAHYRLIFYAASMRLAAAFVMALLVATSVLREIDDKVVDLILSRPVSRTDWYVGKLLGYVTAVVCFAVLISLPLVLQAPAEGLSWCYSLALELIIVVAATLAFAITLRHIAIAISAVAGFYILSRGIAGLALISTGPTVDQSLPSSRFLAWAVDSLAHLLPDLDRFTQASWLVEGAPSTAALAMLTVQTLIYTSLLIGVGLFDLHRRNF